MANMEKTVAVIFSGEDSSLGSSIHTLSASMDAFDKQVSKISDPLAAFGEKVLKLDAAIAAMAIGAITLAVKKAADFDESFGAISTRISGTSGDINKFRDDILTYAQGSTKSLNDINDAVSQAMQKGIGYKDSLEMVSIAEKLSIAGRGDLKSATELLTTTMNAYGASSSDAGHYADVFTAAVKQGAGSIPALADGLGKVAGLAAAAGVPIETITAAIAALGAQGIPTETAIMGLTRTIANLLDPTKEAKELAAQLGLQFNATALKTQGLETVLKNASTATHGNAEQMKELFGSVKGLTVAVDLAVDSHGKFKAALDATRHASGTMAEAYEKEKDELGKVTQNIKNNIDVVLIDLGTKLLPGVGKIGSSLADVFKGVKIGIDAGAFDPVTDFLNKSAGDIEKFLGKLAAAFPGALKNINWDKLIDALNSIGGAMSDALGGKDVDAKKLGDAIQFVVDSVASLIDVTKGIGEVWVGAFGGIIDGFNQLSSNAKQTLGDVLGLALGFKLFGGTWTIIMMAMAGDSEDMSTVVTLAFSSIDTGIKSVKEGALVLLSVIAMVTGGILVLMKAITFGQNDYINGELEKAEELLRKLGDMAVSGADKLTVSANATRDAMGALGGDSSAAADKVGRVGQALKDVPAETKAKIALDAKEFEDWKIRFQASSDAFNLSLKPVIDKTALKDTEDTIYGKFGGAQMIKITTNLDGSSTIETVDKFNNAFPKEKKIEVKPDITQVTIAEMKGKTDIIQKSIEFKGKIDIAQIEAGTKVMEAAFKSVNVSIESTGKTLTDLTSSYTDLLKSGKSGSYIIEDQIREESRRRDEAMSMQKDLVEAQVKNMDARTEAMKSGQAMIQIDGKGLQPQLEAFMFEVLKAIQIRANAEGAQYLVGM
jgi:TP901 family phage tail tape measure protein